MQHRTIRKWCLVFWTTLLRRYHGFYLTILEILFPPSVLVLLMFLCESGNISTKEYNNETIHYTKDEIAKPFHTIVYYPDHPEANKLMEPLGERFNLKTQAAKSDFDLNFQLHKRINKREAIGVIIDVKELLATSILVYEIRAFNNDSELKHMYEHAPQPKDAKAYKFYLESGFAYAQILLALGVIRYRTRMDYFLEVSIQRLPYPPYEWYHYTTFEKDIITSYLYASFLFIGPLVIIQTNIVSEKVSGIRELTKIMGISSRLIWANWYFYGFITLLPASIICAFLAQMDTLFYTPIFPTTDITLVIVFLFLCSTYVLSFCFLYAALWSSVKGALITTLINWWLVPYLHHRLIVWYGSSMEPFILENSFAVLPPLIIRQGFNTLLIFENFENGLQWDTLTEYALVNYGHLRMQTILIVLSLKSFVIFLIAWAIQDFRLLPFKKPIKVHSLEDIPLGFEPILEPRDVTIEILNLSIKYKGIRKVQDIYMDIFTKSTTILLGRGGSGKSSVVHAITGLYPPHRGRILVGGYDVAVDPSTARKNMSLCLEDNRFFMFLTIYEHLFFFAKLRGLGCKTAQVETVNMLRIFDLYEKMNSNPFCQSATVKRQVCVSMALIGHPKIIVLDEPTYGLDLITKKKIWNILQQLRGHATIIISTADMEEAELLGDQIAIFGTGRILCLGTPTFLKEHIGIGYFMRADISSISKEQEITKIIQSIVPKSKLVNITTNFLKYSIPTRDMRLISNISQAMEKKKDKCQIKSFRLQKADINDIYFKPGEEGMIQTADKLPDIPNCIKNKSKYPIPPHCCKTIVKYS